MEYLVSFDDGSSGHLIHYGVKGMRWGEWNAETAARYSGGSSDRRQQAEKDHADAMGNAAINSAVMLAKTGGNIYAGSLSFGLSYATSRVASKTIRTGKSAIDRLVKDPEKKEKAQRNLEDRVNAAAIGTNSGAFAFVATGGNVPTALATFGVTYASARIAQKATRAGKPVIDKLVKKPEHRKLAYAATELTLRAAANAGLSEVGRSALTGLVLSSDAQSRWNQLRRS